MGIGSLEASVLPGKVDAPIRDSSSVFWPGDLLPDECPDARIMVYGYDSHITKHMTGATSSNTVFSHAKDFMFALGRARALGRLLVLVAHSLGGIIVKEVSFFNCCNVIVVLSDTKARCLRDHQRQLMLVFKILSIARRRLSFLGHLTEAVSTLLPLAKWHDRLQVCCGCKPRLQSLILLASRQLISSEHKNPSPLSGINTNSASKLFRKAWV